MRKYTILVVLVLLAFTPLAFADMITGWGNDSFGQVSNIPDGDDFVSISAGVGHGLALRADGSLAAWGDSRYGKTIAPTGTDFQAISTGGHHNLALKKDGSLVAWGYNGSGETDCPGGTNFSAIAGGWHHSLALKSDGSLVGWGYNNYGQADVPTGNDFVAIETGLSHSLALRSDGSIIAWGWNDYNQADPPLGVGFLAVDGGSMHSLAIRSNGSLVAWGNVSGGLNNIPSGNDFVEIASGSLFNVAMRSDGSLIAWGEDIFGQLDVPVGIFNAIDASHEFGLALSSIPEPIPPTANINGPYTVYVGDSLTLDGNGSTDPDGDIVSCLWDLDDDGVFETDAGMQMIFPVDYSYLESLGLLINHTYTIHLKVIDNDGLSGIATSTLTIIPKPAVKVTVDIKPGSCPNPVNTRSSGVLPVAILGSNDLDVTMIDLASIRLACVEPLRSAYEDVAAPAPDITDCNRIETGPDGLLDLTLKFATQAIIEAIGDVDDGDIVTLELTGILYDPIPHETPIEGSDCILIKGKYKAHNKADINRDGVVDGADFFLMAENWLQ